MPRAHLWVLLLLLVSALAGCTSRASVRTTGGVVYKLADADQAEATLVWSLDDDASRFIDRSGASVEVRTLKATMDAVVRGYKLKDAVAEMMVDARTFEPVADVDCWGGKEPPHCAPLRIWWSAPTEMFGWFGSPLLRHAHLDGKELVFGLGGSEVRLGAEPLPDGTLKVSPTERSLRSGDGSCNLFGFPTRVDLARALVLECEMGAGRGTWHLRSAPAQLPWVEGSREVASRGAVRLHQRNGPLPPQSDFRVPSDGPSLQELHDGAREASPAFDAWLKSHPRAQLVDARSNPGGGSGVGTTYEVWRVPWRLVYAEEPDVIEVQMDVRRTYLAGSFVREEMTVQRAGPAARQGYDPEDRSQWVGLMDAAAWVGRLDVAQKPARIEILDIATGPRLSVYLGRCGFHDAACRSEPQDVVSFDPFTGQLRSASLEPGAAAAFLRMAAAPSSA